VAFKVDVNRRSFERIRSATQLLQITEGDMRGPVLTRTAQVHRVQEREIFSSEGALGGSGPWAPLSPAYAARKRAAMLSGRRERRAAKSAGGLARIAAALGLQKSPSRPISMKILVWSGDMRDRFLTHGRKENIERYVPTGPGRGELQFGAESQIASYHVAGSTTLPRRDMIVKTRQQVIEILDAIVRWVE